MSKRYKGGIISATAPTTSSSAATGIWTLEQQMQAIAGSGWPEGPPVIGQVYGGGFFAGQISTAGNGIADYNLVIGPVASAQTTNKQWKTSASSTSGTDSVINGPANSAAMNSPSHPAAEFCEAVTAGGFTDWYMPAKNEIEICYYNLKPDTQNNDTSFGINPNAVPARASPYTTGTPARTSAAAFQFGGAEAFTTAGYWSSTQYLPSLAWLQVFDTGVLFYYTKTFYRRVRAVRRVAV
jgi:hypothetical protein